MAEFNAKQQLPGLLDWMRAQMKACGGKTAVIGALDKIDEILAGRSGTRVVAEEGVVFA